MALASCASHRQQGVRDAERDFSNGIMQLETYGLQRAEDPYRDSLLKHGIEQKTVAGCLVDDKILEHAEGYNETMKRLINAKMGKEFFRNAP